MNKKASFDEGFERFKAFVASMKEDRSKLLFITNHEDKKFKSAREVIEFLYKIGSRFTSHTKNGRKQRTGSYRSFTDMARIVWHYLPDATPLQIFKGIKNARFIATYWGRDEVQRLMASYCPNVRKVVYSKQGGNFTQFDSNGNIGVRGVSTSNLKAYCEAFEESLKQNEQTTAKLLESE